MKKNDFNKIMIAMFTAFMICLMSFLTAFGCFKSIQQEDCIASASIVEEDYDISSNDTITFGFNGSSVYFYRYQNNLSISYYLRVDLLSLDNSLGHNNYVLFSMKALVGSTFYTFGDSSSHTSFSSFLFNSSSTNFFMGTSTNGFQCYGFNDSNLNRYSNVDTIVRGWYTSVPNSTSFGEIIGFDYGCIDSNSISSYDWIGFASNSDIFVLSYFDENGNRLSFASSSYLNGIYSYYPMRRYLFSNTSSEEYTNGYNNGYNVGVGDGYNNGYNDGSSIGYNNGYNIGYIDGENATNPYTFLALLTAVVDAPVQVFSNLFDWNFLGFNLKNFFLSLITICVILIILKYVLGGAGGD